MMPFKLRKKPRSLVSYTIANIESTIYAKLYAAPSSFGFDSTVLYNLST